MDLPDDELEEEQIPEPFPNFLDPPKDEEEQDLEDGEADSMSAEEADEYESESEFDADSETPPPVMELSGDPDDGAEPPEGADPDSDDDQDEEIVEEQPSTVDEAEPVGEEPPLDEPDPRWDEPTPVVEAPTMEELLRESEQKVEALRLELQMEKDHHERDLEAAHDAHVNDLVRHETEINELHGVHERTLHEQLAATTEHWSSITTRLSDENAALDRRKGELEVQLSAAHLRIAELEYESGRLRAYKESLSNKKLWMVIPTHKPGQQGSTRLYVVASGLAEVVDKITRSGILRSDEIANASLFVDKVVF